MSENKIAAKNIRFEYADNMVPDSNREQGMTNNINSWLGQFTKEINGQMGAIVVYFGENNEQRVHLDNMSDDLKATLYRHLQKFQPPDNRHSDSAGK
jgi:hypothetical protein